MLDENQKEEFLDDITDLYEDIRDDHYENLKEKRYLTLEQARAKSLKLEFNPVRPSFLGTKVYQDVDLSQLLPYVDWKYFFDVWQLRGRYPNGKYPKIFNDEKVGEEASKLFEDAQMMLRQVIDQHLLKAKAILGFYPANSVGDDIHVFANDEDLSSPIAVFHGLRQQMEVDGQNNYLCLSDFVAPKESGVVDYIGVFATSAGFGCDKLCANFEENHDDYNSLMIKALADRLSEALAEKLHLDVRKSHWGYKPDESLSTHELLKVSYDGIRPAAGYPTQPDHTEKLTMWNLLSIEEETGIALTDSLAMLPAASVSGLYFAHPKASYFSVGKIQKDQVIDYAKRKHQSVTETENWLQVNLGYEN